MESLLQVYVWLLQVYVWLKCRSKIDKWIKMNENQNIKYLFKVKDQVIFFVKHFF